MPTSEYPHLPSLRRAIFRLLGRILTRRRAALLAALVMGFLLITPLATYAYFAKDINSRESIMNRKETGVVLKDRSGEIFFRQGTLSTEDDLTLDQISDNVEKALIASEDQTFYEHEGYSVRGIAAALYANVLQKDATRYGGSTITQQLVKNRLLTPEKSYVRKYQEVSMAVAMERRYDKDEILEMYLNSVYFGEGAFGIYDAAKTYFNKSPADLTLAESALIIGLLPAPNLYSPLSGEPGKAAEGQARVLERMEETGTITAAEHQQALAEQLTFAERTDNNLQHAQHYALMVLDELREQYGEERITRDGFEVTTTLDLRQQKQAEEILRRRVASFADQGGRNGGLVAIEPGSGAVRALVGSVDWSNQEFGKVNMALMPRQPGSAFKPIYYAEALDKGVITAATILRDRQTAFGDWTPQNYDFRFRGDVSVRTALALSLNIPAAEVMQKLGPAAASRSAQHMGISTVTEPEKYGLTLSLGTAETRLLEMTNAYAAFADGGMQSKPVLVQSVKDKYGKIIYEHQSPSKRRILGEGAAYIISSILSDQAARAPTFGSSLTVPGRVTAAKTGTTNDNKDAWTIGYAPGLAVGIWVGNNENQPMSGLAGASSAGIIWRESMTALLAGTPAEQFRRPAEVIELLVCRGSGKKAHKSSSNTYKEYFIRGYEPAGSCRIEEPEKHQKPEKPEPEKHRNQSQDIRTDNEPIEQAAAPLPPKPPLTPPHTPVDTPDVGGVADKPNTHGDTGGRGGGPPNREEEDENNRKPEKPEKEKDN